MFEEDLENENHETEEMTPEEESFSQRGINPAFQGAGSEKDAKNLKDKINQGRSKNKQDTPQQQDNSSDKKNPSDDNQEEDEKEKKKKEKEEAKEKLQDPEYQKAVEAIKIAAAKAGVPEAIVNKILESKAGQAALDEIKALIDEIEKKKKQIIKRIIAVALPYLITILSIVFVAGTIMTEFYKIVESVDQALVKVDETGQRILNFATGNGWNTEEEQFFKTLRIEFEESKKYTNGKGINVPLIAATIHYNYMIDLSVYEDDPDKDTKGENLHDSSPSSDDDALFDDFISTTETKNFYQTANDKLGKVGPTLIGNSRLLGHIVSPKVTWKKETFGEALEDWNNFFAYYGKNLPGIKDILSIMLFPAKIAEVFTTIYDYNGTNDEGAGWFKYQTENFAYEFSEIIATFTADDSYAATGVSQSEIDAYGDDEEALKNAMNQKGGSFPAPEITYEFDAEVYMNYLRNVYIPLTYGVGKARNYGNDENADTIIDTIVKEIFSQADTFNELFNYDAEQGSSCHYEYRISGSEGAETVIKTKNGIPITTSLIDNMKVRVSKNDGTIDEVSMKDYVMGVTYAESSGGQTEAKKANMIAQQSFLFSRANVTEENGTYYFSIISSSDAQNYCNVHTGCTTANNTEKRSLTEKEIESYSEAYESIKYQLLYDEEAKTVIAYYRAYYTQCPSYATGKCMGQRDSYSDEETGSNYKGILAKYYTQLSLIDVLNGGIAGRTYVCYSSGLLAGNHGNFPIRTEAKTVITISPYNLMSMSNYGECVWYAKGRAMEIISTVTNIDESRRNYIINQLKDYRTGNGNQYCDRLLELKSENGQPLFGTSTDYHEVKPGSLACYDNYVALYDGWYGHVIVIEDVSGDTVTVSQMGKGFGVASAYFNTRTYSIEEMAKIKGSTSSYETTKFIRYIYLLD